jgi:hypothetical protein
LIPQGANFGLVLLRYLGAGHKPGIALHQSKKLLGKLLNQLIANF